MLLIRRGEAAWAVVSCFLFPLCPLAYCSPSTFTCASSCVLRLKSTECHRKQDIAEGMDRIWTLYQSADKHINNVNCNIFFIVELKVPSPQSGEALSCQPLKSPQCCLSCGAIILYVCMQVSLQHQSAASQSLYGLQSLRWFYCVTGPRTSVLPCFSNIHGTVVTNPKSNLRNPFLIITF